MARISLRVFFVCVIALSGNCNAKNLLEKMQSVAITLNGTSNSISKFVSLLYETKLNGIVSDWANITVFVPTDKAFQNIPSLGSVDNIKAKNEKKALINCHTATLTKVIGDNSITVVGTTSIFGQSGITESGTDIGFGRYVKLKSTSGEIPLYWLKSTNASNTEYYINNAELVNNLHDQTVSNGVFHVINEVIYPIAQQQLMYNYLKGNNTFSTFYGLVQKLDSMTSVDATKLRNLFKVGSKISTFFIPPNSAFSSAAIRQVDSKIKNNETRLIQFVQSHVADDQLIFVSWMKHRREVHPKLGVKHRSTIDSTVYRKVDMKKNFVSAGGVTAEILGQTTPFQNGLLFVINKPLNFLYETIEDILKRKASNFHSACSSVSECSAYMKNGNCTFFAPEEFTLNTVLTGKELRDVLLLHILPNRRLSVAALPEPGAELDSAGDAGKIRFTVAPNSVSVGGRLNGLVGGHYSQGFVSADISNSDIAGTNGMVQVVRTPIGYPTQTIAQLLESKLSHFGKLINYLKHVNINFNDVKTRRYTMIAPTNEAFNAMTDDTGKKILADEKGNLRKLLKRLIFMDTVLMSNVTLNQKYEVVTALKYDNADENTVTKFVVQMTRGKADKEVRLNIGETNVFATFKPYESEWGCTNGIVYALNRIPYGATTVGSVCKPEFACSALGKAKNLSWLLTFFIVAMGRWSLNWIRL